VSARSWASTLWPSVDTLAYPNFMVRYAPRFRTKKGQSYQSPDFGS
jgi:hypothetical protein